MFGRNACVFNISRASPVSTAVITASAPVVAVVVTTFCLGRPVAKAGVLNVFIKTTNTLALVLDKRRATMAKGNDGGI